MTYRGGYAMFHEAVAILAARGVFDPTEVTDYNRDSPGYKAVRQIGEDDSFIQMFPKFGRFQGCKAERHKEDGIGNFFTVSYDADRGQFLERMQFESSRDLPDTFIVNLVMKDFTYEYSPEVSSKSEFTLARQVREGKFRRPDRKAADDEKQRRRDEAQFAKRAGDRDLSELAGGECPSGGDSGRTVQHPETCEKQAGEVQNNADGKSGGDTPLDTRRVISGFRRCGVVRHGDDRDAGVRKQRLPDGKFRPVSQGRSDKPRCEKLDERSDRKLLKGFSRPNI